MAEPDVRRRFVRSAANFASYSALADRWRLFDNSGLRPVCVAEGAGSRAEFADAAGLAALPAPLAAVSRWPGLSP